MEIALILVGILLLIALVAAAGGFDRSRRGAVRRPSRRRAVTRERVVDPPVERTERIIED